MSEQEPNSPQPEGAEAVAGKLEKFFAPGQEPEEKKEEQAPAEGAAAEGAEQAETPSQPEEREVVIDGETYLVPAKIAERFIQHADYTRKTQDIAERSRALSAEKEALALQRTFEESATAERNQLALVEAQIASYARLDWQGMDTEQLLKHRTTLDQLKDARAGLQQQLEAKRKEFDAGVRNVMQQALEAGTKYVTQHVKGFDDKAKRELFGYGRTEGYTEEELGRIVDPRLIVTLWKAWQWDRLKATQPGIENKAARAAPVLRPGATQRQVPAEQKARQAIKAAKGRSEKTRAAEDYFTQRFR